MKTGISGEELFFELALQDLTRAADLFAPVHERTAGVDGFVSLELSPLLAYDTKKSVSAAKFLHGKGNRPNLFIKIPGTSNGVPAIEESIANGIAINVTLLFYREQYLASAEAYMWGLERRVSARLSLFRPDVRSVASVFLSRWDGATIYKVPDALRDKLGVAIGQQVYKAYRDTLESDRWQRLANFGAVRSACSLPALEPRIPRRRMFSISTRLPRRTRLIPCRRRLFLRSVSMGT